ncbi:protein sprouty [Eupeodes corollae]|uniref:protein sprouty n=1 Tax=Eupeodes corollae TaxID=290404 RepID=UPI002490AAB7|nr:protein sprouty [Eupeodes corollae]XP_055913850.1 protein sprouty [Eupeodes corollae]
MDRRNGGDPLAPPRPPKLLPRVHRPRAAEPPMMSAPPTQVQHQHQQQQQQLCTNNHLSSRSNNTNNNNNHTNSSNSINSNSNSNNRLNNTIASSRNSNNINNNSSSSNTTHLTTPLLQLHHHQQQQQQHPHTTVSLNRNNSNLSSASSTSSVSTTVSSVNSFTRRRPPPPPLAALTLTAPSSSPILPLLGASLNLNLLNNNININSIEPVPVSPVTLAAPRPESERLTNEYVDTPFRTAQQLQQASRNQHPAGQHIHGQTTTQHNLLLLQQSQRQQQQHNQQQQQQHHSSHHQSSGSHSNVVGTCVVSAATAASIHSNSRSLKGDATGGTGTTPGFGASHATSTTPASANANATLATSPPTITRLQQHHRPNALPITQPITKQPASTTTFKKDLSESMFHEDPLDLHHIGGGGASAGSMGSGSLGSPIGGIILGDGAINPITCPRCERCRCEQCQSPRQLPQTWVCNKTCLCSAETIIDYASCLCCVKALFYHCARDQDMECDDGDSTLCVDDPCSCLPNKRTQRWGWLGALSLVLPCLWCYWPMRGCVAICEKCYARHAGHGCRCQAIGSTSSMLPIVNIGRSGTGGTNATIGGTKSSGISGGVHSGISGSGNGHHHHHHHHGGGGGGGNNGGSEISAARILRKCDITPEKRLLDSSPEY